jgi:hypothetical protein
MRSCSSSREIVCHGLQMPLSLFFGSRATEMEMFCMDGTMLNELSWRIYCLKGNLSPRGRGQCAQGGEAADERRWKRWLLTKGAAATLALGARRWSLSMWFARACNGQVDIATGKGPAMKSRTWRTSPGSRPSARSRRWRRVGACGRGKIERGVRPEAGEHS